MKALGYAASRLLPLASLAGLSAATLHTVLGTVTAVLTAVYTAFITIEAGLRLYERMQARKAASRSPRTRSDA